MNIHSDIPRELGSPDAWAAQTVLSLAGCNDGQVGPVIMPALELPLHVHPKVKNAILFHLMELTLCTHLCKQAV